MPAQATEASALLRIIRSDPELRRAVLTDPDHYGSNDSRIRVATSWAIGLSVTAVVVLTVAQAMIFFVMPLPESHLRGLIPDWQLRLANLGPLSTQLLTCVFVWSLAETLATRRERRIARKLLDALAPGFDRRGLRLRPGD
jgi:hypothetical protein